MKEAILKRVYNQKFSPLRVYFEGLNYIQMYFLETKVISNSHYRDIKLSPSSFQFPLFQLCFEKTLCPRLTFLPPTDAILF